MANELSNIRTVLASLETSFGVRNSPASFAHAQVFDLEHDFRREALPDETMRGQRGENPTVPGRKAGSTVSHKIYCVGHQGDGTGAISASGGSHVHDPFWSAAVGAGVGGTGTTIVSGTDSSIVITGTGNIAAGTVCGFDNGSGVIDWRYIRSVTPGANDTVVPSRALSFTPAGGEQVYATVSYQAAFSPSSAGPSESLQLQIAGMSTDSDWEAYGLGCSSWSLERLEVGKLVTAKFDWMAADFTDDTSVIGAIAPTAATLLRKSPWVDSEVSVWDYAAGAAAYASADDRALRTLTGEHQVGVAIRPDPNSALGIAGWNYSGGGIGNIGFTMDITDDWRDDWYLGAASGAGVQYYGAMITCGRLNGKTWGIYYDRLHQTREPGVGTDGDQMIADVAMAVSPDWASTDYPFVVWMG